MLCSKESLVTVISMPKKFTLLLCINKYYTDKQVSLVIGKFVRLRCFKNVKKLLIVYHLNSKAGMKNDSFTKLLRAFYKSIRTEKGKIILFIDNFSAHSRDTLSLKIIKVSFSSF